MNLESLFMNLDCFYTFPFLFELHKKIVYLTLLRILRYMKSKQPKKIPYIPFQSYCLRLPTLPFDFLKNLTSKTTISDTALFEKFEIPIIQEAIFLASPEFHAQIEKWRKGEIKDLGKQERIRHSFLKYLSRMASRCTPFGLFAHCCTGYFGEVTHIEPDTPEAYKKVTRYDMHFLVLFSQHLIQKAHIKKQLRFYPNSTLYQMGDRYRYVEYQYEQKRRVHSLESVLHSPFLEAVLGRARQGTTLSSLSDVLVQMDIDRTTAEGFIGELIENQLIKSELEPTLTGDDFLIQLEQKLAALDGVDDELALIKTMKTQLAQLDRSIGSPIDLYTNVHNLLAPLPIDFERKYVLQTDMFSTLKKNTLDKSTMGKVKEGIRFLNKISPPSQNQNLNRFKSAFIQRYEHEKIPLLQVLDVETGIGYVQDPNSVDATPFLDDIVLPHESTSQSQQYQWSALDHILHEKLQKSLNNGNATIFLEDSDFETQNPHWKNAPDTIASLIEIVQEGEEEYIVMSHAGGSSAANLIARFSYGDDGLLQLARDITAQEAKVHADKVLAEIVHLPESRTGNVLRRPHLRSYEIPCLGKSDLPQTQQIAMEDLEVTVKYDTIVLYSKKLGKEIRPQLTNAHNYSYNALPAYHFLCDLQHQNRNGFGFSWNSFFTQYPYLPRVMYKNIILSKARWHLKKTMIADILNAMKNQNLDASIVQEWRKVHHLPHWVQLVDGDNTLTVNLKNLSSVSMLFDTVKNRTQFVLEEFLFAGDTLIKNREGNYANQALFTFYKEPTTLETA